MFCNEEFKIWLEKKKYSAELCSYEESLEFEGLDNIKAFNMFCKFNLIYIEDYKTGNKEFEYKEIEANSEMKLKSVNEADRQLQIKTLIKEKSVVETNTGIEDKESEKDEQFTNQEDSRNDNDGILKKLKKRITSMFKRGKR